MKKALLALLPLLLVLLSGPDARSQCHALFTWEQIPGTLQLHYHSTSTSEHDITSYSWTFGDGGSSDGQNPYHTYDLPGTYTVCLLIMDNAGCASDICHQVTVNAASDDCDAAFEWEQVPGTLTIHYDNNATSGHDIISYAWTFGDGETSDGHNPNHTYDQPGTYVVCLTITDNVGCTSDICHEVHVEAAGSECHAIFDWEQLQNPLSYHFHNQATSNHDIISYAWTFGDGGTSDAPHPYHTYDEPGTYVVCLTITDNVGCVSEVCHELHVEGSGEPCHADFTWEQIPGTLQIHFHNTSTSEQDIVLYSWNFGDGHLGDGQNPYHTYEEAGTYVVCLLIQDAAGCASDICYEVHVEAAAACHANFTWEHAQGNPLEIHFHSTSNSQHDIISYMWTFGDGSTGDAMNPTHVYAEAGTYVVCLTITDNTGCVSEECHEVHVEAPVPCHANFTWEHAQGNPLEIHFHSTSNSQHDIISYMWTFGDGSTGDAMNPTHVYAEAGTYVVCLTITDNTGCVSEECHEVHVEAPVPCHANFTWEHAQGNPLEIHFHSTSNSQHDIISYMWTFGDGSTGDAMNPTHVYAEAGTYVVCLTITDNTGCVSEECHEVHVEAPAPCHAEFTWEHAQGNPLEIHFHSTSTSQHDIISYQWSFGDGSTSDNANPTHVYDEPGTYVVCLTITDNAGCVSDVCHELHIGTEGYNAVFMFYVESDGIIHFNNQSTGTTPNTTWFWDFGDGASSTEENPIHEYGTSGIYTTCMYISDTTLNSVDTFCLTVAYELVSTEDGHGSSTSLAEDVKIIHYTNPATDQLIIEYYMAKPLNVQFDLYDLTGIRTNSVLTGILSEGKQTQTMDVGHLHSGLYVLSITSGTERKTIRVIIAR